MNRSLTGRIKFATRYRNEALFANDVRQRTLTSFYSKVTIALEHSSIFVYLEIKSNKIEMRSVRKDIRMQSHVKMYISKCDIYILIDLTN